VEKFWKKKGKKKGLKSLFSTSTHYNQHKRGREEKKGNACHTVSRKGGGKGKRDRCSRGLGFGSSMGAEERGRKRGGEGKRRTKEGMTKSTNLDQKQKKEKQARYHSWNRYSFCNLQPGGGGGEEEKKKGRKRFDPLISGSGWEREKGNRSSIPLHTKLQRVEREGKEEGKGGRNYQ